LEELIIVTQIFEMESRAERDPAVVAWGEILTGVALKEAFSELLDRASENGRKLIADNIGPVVLKAVPDLAS
jgi:hypothetical protein